MSSLTCKHFAPRNSTHPTLHILKNVKDFTNQNTLFEKKHIIIICYNICLKFDLAYSEGDTTIMHII